NAGGGGRAGRAPHGGGWRRRRRRELDFSDGYTAHRSTSSGGPQVTRHNVRYDPAYDGNPNGGVPFDGEGAPYGGGRVSGTGT
ncbi:unnamed protein product, partial [Ectocarpus sp. 12 AP-2014]